MGSVRCLIRYKTERVHVLGPLLTSSSLRTTGTLYSALSRARQKMTMESTESENKPKLGADRIPNGGNGRPKGATNKITRELKEMILGALDKAGGEAYLCEQAEKSPAAFMTLIGKVLPMQVNAEVNATINHEDWLATLK